MIDSQKLKDLIATEDEILAMIDAEKAVPEFDTELATRRAKEEHYDRLLYLNIANEWFNRGVEASKRGEAK